MPTSTHAAGIGEQLRQLSSTSEAEFLPIDEAFQGSANRLGDELIVRFSIAKGYYLYRDRFGFKAEGTALGPVTYPEGELKNDEFLGEQVVYHDFVELHVPVSISAASPAAFDLEVQFQGCAEKGLCYPPTTRNYHISAVSPASPLAAAPAVEVNIKTPASASPDRYQAWLSRSLGFAMTAFVLIGVTLTFTPCVLPMLPITLGILGANSTASNSKRLLLIFLYVQAMAVTYALLGLAVASAGAALQGYLQAPAVLIAVTLIFISLALSMFGAFELQLPALLRQHIGTSPHANRYLGVIIMGVLSALVVSPCISAPLAGALLFIAESGDQLRGALVLYALGLGMGLPLLAAGLLGSHILPRAGAWMEKVKQLMGFLLLGVAIVVLNRLLPAFWQLLLWSVLGFALAAWLAALVEHLKTGGHEWRTVFVRAAFYLTLIYAACVLVGALSGARDPLAPFAGLQAGSTTQASGTNTASTSPLKSIDHSAFARIKSADDLAQAIARANADGKTVMLDFFADWCVACFEFAEQTFPDPAVQAALAGTVLLQADVTANDEVDRALMTQLQIQGLPSILFFDLSGKEIGASRVAGFIPAAEFSAHIERVLGR